MLVDAVPRLTQGDLIYGVPFLQIPKNIGVKFEGVEGQTRIGVGKVLPADNALTELRTGQAVIPVAIGLGVVLSQSCDLDNRDQVALARVSFLQNLIEDYRDALELEEPDVCTQVILDLCRNRGYNHLAYLGKVQVEGEERHIGANLLAAQVLPKAWQPVLVNQRLFSLTDDGLRYFQSKLSNLTGRYALNDEFFWAPETDVARYRDLRDATAAFERLKEKRRARQNK